MCPVCQRSYGNFREFLLIATPLGSTLSYDAEMNDWNPERPLGTATFANCPCGNTLSLNSAGMPNDRLWPLMLWARAETQRRGITIEQLLNYLREEMRKQVLGPANQDEPGRGIA